MKLILASIILMICSTTQAAQYHTLYAFESKTCGPCRQMQPVLKKLERRGIRVVRIDVDSKSGRALAAKYDVDAVPTYISVDNRGREQGREVGVVSEGVLLALLKIVKFLVYGLLRLIL